MGELSLEVDEEQDRMYLRLAGSFEEGEAQEFTDKVIGSATRFDSEFDVINDISELHIGDPGAVEQLERAKEGLAERGLNRVVRIPPTAVSGEEQYREAGADAESYDIHTADSVAEAERLLDGE